MVDWRKVILVGIAGLALAGCNKDSATPDSSAESVLPPSSDTVGVIAREPAVAITAAPTIAGSPSGTATVGIPYNFSPGLTNPVGGLVTFQITGKPAWATFNVATGNLSGTPTAENVGQHGGIVITATDGTRTSSMQAFSIEVRAAAVASGNGTAVLSWLPPVDSGDANPLPTLGGYRIYHGPSADSLRQVVQIASAGITSHVFDSLPAGAHFFAISTLSSAGVESAMSSVLSKTVL